MFSRPFAYRSLLTVTLFGCLLSACASSGPLQESREPRGHKHAKKARGAPFTPAGSPVALRLWHGDAPISPAQDPSLSPARKLGKWEISGAFVEPVAHGRTVPSFQLVSPSGEIPADFQVGEQALVVVFFASWSELCSHKMKTIRIATERVVGAKLVFVSLDGPDTIHHVPGFLREHRLSGAPVVNGLENPAFLASYNPTSSLPHVAVVGRYGSLVHEQIGLHSGDGVRLEEALRLALDEPRASAH